MSLLHSVLYGFLRLVNFVFWLPISLFVENPYKALKDRFKGK